MTIIDNKLLRSLTGVGICEMCWEQKPLVPHHVQSRGPGGGSRVDAMFNLVRLCFKCHDDGHNGRIHFFAAKCWAIIDKREGYTPGTAKEKTAEFLRTPK